MSAIFLPRSLRHLFSLYLFLVLVVFPTQAKWKYLRDGNAADSAVTPRAGFALMGGGSRLEAAFRFLCERANGGDFLVLSANDDDDYLEKENAMIRSICPLNSVATLSFFSREDARDPEVIKIIEQAESIFIAGGDQSRYVRYWQDTPVQDRRPAGKDVSAQKVVRRSRHILSVGHSRSRSGRR